VIFALVFKLNTVLPANTEGEIYVPKLALSNVVVTESGTTVWKNGHFVSGIYLECRILTFSGTDGISSGMDNGQEIVFQAGSGSYSFELTGTQGLLACDGVNEVNKPFSLFSHF
jgi:hypothetical protein